MMQLIDNLPDFVVGVRASGEVDAKDYETVLMPALESALKRHDRVRVLYQFTPDFTGFTVGAMWDDTKLGLTEWKAYERIAVVTDVGWITHGTRLFAFLMPGEVKVFTNAKQDEAIRWITT